MSNPLDTPPGALPLLEYALTDLFDHRTNGVIALETYQRLGGVTKALARRADEVYEILNERQQAATRQLFLRLVSLGEGTEDTRRRALQSELLSIGGAEMPLALDAFGESRLLTFDTSSTTHANGHAYRHRVADIRDLPAAEPDGDGQHKSIIYHYSSIILNNLSLIRLK